MPIAAQSAVRVRVSNIHGDDSPAALRKVHSSQIVSFNKTWSTSRVAIWLGGPGEVVRRRRGVSKRARQPRSANWLYILNTGEETLHWKMDFPRRHILTVLSVCSRPLGTWDILTASICGSSSGACKGIINNHYYQLQSTVYCNINIWKGWKVEFGISVVAPHPMGQFARAVRRTDGAIAIWACSS